MNETVVLTLSLYQSPVLNGRRERMRKMIKATKHILLRCDFRTEW